jgi:hypothetical protein
MRSTGSASCMYRKFNIESVQDFYNIFGTQVSILYGQGTSLSLTHMPQITVSNYAPKFKTSKTHDRFPVDFLPIQ